MMEAAKTSETLVNFYQTTRCYNPEDSNLHTHRRENLRSYRVKVDLPAEVVKMFVTTQTSIRLNSVNSALNYNACSNVRKAKRKT
jgi:hypothetical protein